MIDESLVLDRRAVECELRVLVRLEEEAVRLLDGYRAPGDHAEMKDGVRRLRVQAEYHREQARHRLNDVASHVGRAHSCGLPLPPAWVADGEYASGLGQLRNLQRLMLHLATAEGVWASLGKAAELAGRDDLALISRQASTADQHGVRWLEEKIGQLAVGATTRS